MMPLAEAQSTAAVYQTPRLTSANSEDSASGCPSSRWRIVAAMPLVNTSWGAKSLSVIPFINSRSHRYVTAV